MGKGVVTTINNTTAATKPSYTYSGAAMTSVSQQTVYELNKHIKQLTKQNNNDNNKHMLIYERTSAQVLYTAYNDNDNGAAADMAPTVFYKGAQQQQQQSAFLWDMSHI